MGINPPPIKSLGQHFLFDPNILGRITALAEVGPGDAVLEIGPGPGGLTRALSAAGARIWAVEADRRMVEHLNALEIPGLKVFQGDALKADFGKIAEEAGGKLKLVANLPYNISGPLTAKLLLERAAFTDMTLMYQKEVAERIAAGPGGKERGILSVLTQVFCEVRMGFKVPPGAFRPPPKVHSAVIRLIVPASPLFDLHDEEVLWKIVHEAFRMRRKQLKNCLRHRPGAEEAIGEAGLTGVERPEELSNSAWVALANAFARVT